MEERKTKFLILSADDDENAHLLLTRAFSKTECAASLVQVHSGLETIDYLAGKGKFSDRTAFALPDLLLLDLKMPMVSGFDVLEYIRDRDPLKTFPVVVMSSSDHVADREKAQALGCDFYVVKPSNFDDLVDFVKNIEIKFLKIGIRTTNRELSRTENYPKEAASRKIDAGRLRQQQAMKKHSKPVTPEIYQTLVEQIKDYAIFKLDNEGYILSWNEGARRIHGYEASDVIGKHFSIFYPATDVETDKPAFELRMASEIGRYEEEGWRVRKDHSRFWAHVIVTPLRDSEGALTGFAKVTRDLTQEKFQEENLQRLLESEERFRLLVDQVKDYGIFMLDAKGNVSSWNQGAQRIKGYSADEIIGKHFSTFYTREAVAKDHPTNELNIAIREGRYEEEGWRVRKDGTQFWASVVITALWDKRGNLSGFAKVTRDLTQRKLEAEAMQQKTEALEAFAHTLSHDLRGPIRSLSTFADLLLSETEEISEAERKLYLEKIVKSTRTLDTLLQDILHLSQLSLVPAPTENVPFDEVLDETAFLLESEIKLAKAVIDIRKPLPKIAANRTLLVQIFSNLISNALKFVPAGQTPEIKVYADAPNGHFHIHVQDNGHGIPEKLHKRIFDIFERGAASPSTSGTGIGLAIVKKAAERLGATVSVNSNAGEGSDFVVSFPREASKTMPSQSVLNCGFPNPIDERH